MKQFDHEHIKRHFCLDDGPLAAPSLIDQGGRPHLFASNGFQAVILSLSKVRGVPDAIPRLAELRVILKPWMTECFEIGSEHKITTYDAIVEWCAASASSWEKNPEATEARDTGFCPCSGTILGLVVDQIRLLHMVCEILAPGWVWVWTMKSDSDKPNAAKDLLVLGNEGRRLVLSPVRCDSEPDPFKAWL